MTTVQPATATVINGQKYLTTTHRNSEYTLRSGPHGWEVTTRRIGYGGRNHPGGFKRYDTLEALAAGCKAFGDAAAVLAAYYRIVI